MFQQFQMEAKEVAFCFHPSMASASWISAPVIQPSNPCVKD
jgi:hypothetical protein